MMKKFGYDHPWNLLAGAINNNSGHLSWTGYENDTFQSLGIVFYIENIETFIRSKLNYEDENKER